jgi:phage terminase small subunit
MEALRADVPHALFSTLDHREQCFVAAYLADQAMNGAAAARRAGYAVGRANRTAHQKLNDPRIKAALEAAKAARLERLKFEQDDVLRELAVLIKSDVRDYRLADDGTLALREGVDERAWKAVASVKHRTHTTKDGGVTREVEYKLWDKNAALRMAGEHYGLYKQKLEHSGEVKAGVLAVPVPLDADQWAGVAKAQQDALTTKPSGA